MLVLLINETLIKSVAFI